MGARALCRVFVNEVFKVSALNFVSRRPYAVCLIYRVKWRVLLRRERLLIFDVVGKRSHKAAPCCNVFVIFGFKIHGHWSLS
jgi:hypothetical protein